MISVAKKLLSQTRMFQKCIPFPQECLHPAAGSLVTAGQLEEAGGAVVITFITFFIAVSL